MAADCSIGGMAVAVAPQRTTATTPTRTTGPVLRPARPSPDSTANINASPARQPAMATLGRRSPGRASSPIAVSPAMP